MTLQTSCGSFRHKERVTLQTSCGAGRIIDVAKLELFRGHGRRCSLFVHSDYFSSSVGLTHQVFYSSSPAAFFDSVV